MVYALVKEASPASRENHMEDYLNTIDGDFEKVETADLTPDGGLQISNSEFNYGRALKPDHMPTQAKRNRPFEQPLADYMQAPKGAAYVSPRFKELLEQFEPDVHQFFEMSVKSGRKDLGTMYYFVVCNRLDGLDHEACVPPIKPGDRRYKATYTPSDRLVFSAAKVGAAHVWVERHHFGFWMSDAFRNAVVEAGLTGIRDVTRREESI